MLGLQLGDGNEGQDGVHIIIAVKLDHILARYDHGGRGHLGRGGCLGKILFVVYKFAVLIKTI